MKNVKLSIDLVKENKEILEKIKDEKDVSYGYIINTLISTFGDIPETIKKDIINFIKIKIRTINNELNTSDAYMYDDNNKKKQSYSKILKYLNGDKEITEEEMSKETVFTRYAIKNGYLICPSNWIVINPEKADTMMYAGVVECRNSVDFGNKNFGREIPHFVFLSNKKYGKDYDNEYTDFINKLCVKMWPKFQQVIDSQVKPVDDPENPGMILNEKEWINAPIIGHFAIYENGDSLYGPDYEPPMGAKIIRTN